MSSTRHAPAGAAVSFERYMSSPEFVALRGVPGTLVAAKAQLYNDAWKRRLLFFLQSLSLKDGGLGMVAQALSGGAKGFDANELATFLVELCIDPKIYITAPGQVAPLTQADSVIAALIDFKRAYETRIRSEFVLTSIGSEIFETLNHALATQKMVVIEGESGSGKTTSAQAWCDLHQGESRFLTLSGITHKTGFFQRLASVIGLASSNRKAIDMQVKVEEFFRRTRLTLVIDEAHYLWPQHQRSHSTPELINWVNTSLVNQGVPTALICTDQFAKLKARVEKQTGWTSGQLEHRVKRYKKLSSTPTKNDLERIAMKLLSLQWNSNTEQWDRPGRPVARDFVSVVVGYALTCKMRLPAVAKTVAEARYQARQQNRSSLVATDIRSALVDYQIPSETAMRTAFDPPGRRRTSQPVSVAGGLQLLWNDVATFPTT